MHCSLRTLKVMKLIEPGEKLPECVDCQQSKAEIRKRNIDPDRKMKSSRTRTHLARDLLLPAAEEKGALSL